jgi:hypothetical protein
VRAVIRLSCDQPHGLSQAQRLHQGGLFPPKRLVRGRMRGGLFDSRFDRLQLHFFNDDPRSLRFHMRVPRLLLCGHGGWCLGT